MTAPRGIYAVMKNGQEVGRANLPDSLARRLPHVVRVGDAPPRTAPPPPWWRRVWSYLAAELSRLVRGPAAASLQERRLAACRACPHREEVPGEGEFCTQCGCGRRRRAELTVKTSMPAAKCPLGKWPANPDPAAQTPAAP